MKEQFLLTKVTMLSEKYDMLYRKTGGYFNIFEVTNTAHDEVTICRVLYELLSPQGTHCQGDTYLRLFLKHVLHLVLSEEEMAEVKVYREYGIDEQRRIDLVIETSRRFLPIEVKIYAGDQFHQCLDYYNYAKQLYHTADQKIYYLTRFGTPPSLYSAAGLTPKGESYDKVVELSFADDILNWLNLCLRESSTLQIAPIREVILQLILTIQKFTNQMENEKQMELKELLLSSPDNLKSAIDIRNTIDEAREDLMIRLFQSIDEKVGQPRVQNEYDYAEYNYQRIKTYYDRKGYTYPGLSYLYKKKDDIGRDQDVWVRLELENVLSVGYCCPDNGKATSKRLSPEDIRTILKVEPRPSGDWWAYLEELIEASSVQCPDFRQHNDGYYALLSPEKLEAFADHCAQRIRELLA